MDVPRHLEDQLARFAQATPELLAERLLLRRVDTKYVFPVAQLDEVLAGLESTYAVLLAGEARVATYNTLYFDTPSRAFFHAHRRGRRRRQKVRIRHYPERELSYLEIKQKEGPRRTRKHRRQRAFGDNELTVDDVAFIAAHVAAKDRFEPAVWTNFSRVTLLGLSDIERVTIDVGLHVEDPGHDIASDFDGVVILELKQPRYSQRTPLPAELKRLGIRPVSASKYCAGIMTTQPEIRQNRLRAALRRLKRANHDDR